MELIIVQTSQYNTLSLETKFTANKLSYQGKQRATQPRANTVNMTISSYRRRTHQLASLDI